MHLLQQTLLNKETGSLLYDNGPHFNVPGNPNISLLEDQALGLNTLGGGVSGDFSITDDFTSTETWDITQVDLYGYQTGAPTAPATITGVTLQIWDGAPDAGGTVIWGDLVTVLPAASIWSNTYRESESNPGTTRAIQSVTVDVTGMMLDPGTYWIDWQYIGDGGFSGPWQPPVVVLGANPSGNALQGNVGSYGAWLDTGTSDNMDAPFQLYGSVILGVDEVSLNDQIGLFPNPAQKEITISNSSNVSLEKADIYNVLGKLIQTVDLSNMASSQTINVGSLSEGMYLVQISSANSTVTKRFVKR